MRSPLPPDIPEIITQRLRLRRWEARDRAPFAAQNADAETMRHLGGPMTRSASDAYLDRTLAQWREDGCGKWAVEERATGAFVGALGLQRIRFVPPFPAADGIEIAWRLTRAFWGRGYATEAAEAAAAFGFGRLGLQEIVAFTVPANAASRAVMERLGMVHDGTFDHPLLAEGHPLRPHVLYRLKR
ncbi:GNAT family N-acetyltransferase [Acidisoma sp. 7E03]